MTSSKYRSLAQNLIENIEQGQIKVNTKLPSLRTFCRVHHISMTTALACYRYLEQHAYLIAESKKGYYVQFPKPTTPDRHFPSFQSVISQAEPNITPVIAQDAIPHHSLAMAQLDAMLIDDEQLKRSLKAVLKEADINLQYDEPQGSLKLREQLSRHFTQQGFVCVPDELVITHGCLDAVLIALECVSKAGDVIAVSSPCYSGLLDILSLLDRAILEIPSTPSGLDLDQLEHAMAGKKISACLLTANYQNPTGHCLSNEQKRQIVLLAHQYKIPIIEDDVFRELSHQRAIPLPMKYFDQQGWVLCCASVSKTLAPGIRIGWCLPGQFTHQFIHQRKVRTLGHNQIIQLALADYICKGFYAKQIKRVNRLLAKSCFDYVAFLQHRLPSQSSLFKPEGGLVLWIRIPHINSERLAEDLAKKGVFIKHGNLFSTTSLYHDCIRINIGLMPQDSVYAQLTLLCQTAHTATLAL